MKKVESAARELGYKRIYLETHNNLKAAIHLYEKCGYKEIERPAAVVHSTMNRFFLKELYSRLQINGNYAKMLNKY